MFVSLFIVLIATPVCRQADATNSLIVLTSCLYTIEFEAQIDDIKILS